MSQTTMVDSATVAPDRGRLIVFSVIHGSDAEHNNSNLKHKELPAEFRRRMDLSGLVNTREHDGDERVGEVLQTCGDDQGRVFMWSAVDTSTQVGADTARDIHDRVLAETSIKHQFIEVDLSKTPTLNGTGGKMSLYIPFEVAYTKKGARNGCKVLFSAYEKEMAQAIRSSEHQFGQVSDKTKKTTLHIVPRDSPTESSSITNSQTVSMSVSANTIPTHATNAPSGVGAPTTTPANVLPNLVASMLHQQPQQTASTTSPGGSNPVAPTLAAAQPNPTTPPAVASASTGVVDPFAAEEAQLATKQRELQTRRAAAAAAAAQTPNLSNPADLMQLVNSYDDKAIAGDLRGAQDLMRVLAKQYVEMSESQKQIYEDTKKSVDDTIKKLSNASKRTGVVSDDLESMMSSYLQNRSLDDLLKSNRIFNTISTAMSAALDNQTQAAPVAAAVPVPPAMLQSMPMQQQQQQQQQQAPFPAVPQQMYGSTNKSLSMKELAQQLGSQPLYARFNQPASSVTAMIPRLTTPSFLGGKLPVANDNSVMQITTSIATAASAARDGTTSNDGDQAAKRQRVNGLVLSDFVSADQLDSISHALMSSPKGSASALSANYGRN